MMMAPFGTAIRAALAIVMAAIATIIAPAMAPAALTMFIPVITTLRLRGSWDGQRRECNRSSSDDLDYLHFGLLRLWIRCALVRRPF
jgi:hypothetical protein